MNYYNTISIMEWAGLKSQKFRGNRSHNHHPSDQLDFKLYSIQKSDRRTGKKHFDQKISSCTEEPFRKFIKTFDQHYKSKILHFPLQPKLIKLNDLPNIRNDSEPQFMKLKNPKKQSYQFLGMSKMKALQKGQKKTGIYRNFSKSQTNPLSTKAKSASLFPAQLFDSTYNYQ